MASVVVRLIRVLPVLAIVALVVAILYGVLVASSTRERARRILIRVLTVVFGALTVAFALVTLYAWFEGNEYVLEIADVSAIVFALCLGATRLAHWRMRANASKRSGDGESEP